MIYSEDKWWLKYPNDWLQGEQAVASGPDDWARVREAGTESGSWQLVDRTALNWNTDYLAQFPNKSQKV